MYRYMYVHVCLKVKHCCTGSRNGVHNFIEVSLIQRSWLEMFHCTVIIYSSLYYYIGTCDLHKWLLYSGDLIIQSGFYVINWIEIKFGTWTSSTTDHLTQVTINTGSIVLLAIIIIIIIISHCSILVVIQSFCSQYKPSIQPVLSDVTFLTKITNLHYFPPLSTNQIIC